MENSRSPAESLSSGGDLPSRTTGFVSSKEFYQRQRNRLCRRAVRDSAESSEDCQHPPSVSVPTVSTGHPISPLASPADPCASQPDEDQAEAESRTFHTAVQAMLSYEAHSMAVLERLRECWSLLPAHHKSILPDYEAHHSQLVRCVEQNQCFLKKISGLHESGDSPSSSDAPAELRGGCSHQRSHPLASETDLDKVRTTLRQLVRDWGAEGDAEREQCYTPMLNELDSFFASATDKAKLRVLVPGSGLSRLAYEVAKRRYSCQGNEFSFHMLLVSDYLLNHCSSRSKIFPYIHQTSNVMGREDSIRGVEIPDELPRGLTLAKGQEFTMVGGDFLEVYRTAEHAGKWDAVMTCFFLDTARNPLEYVETVHHLLAPGGVWINLGPLLYHFAEMRSEVSVELSLEELKASIQKLGFRIEREKLQQS
eukprot:RCo029998